MYLFIERYAEGCNAISRRAYTRLEENEMKNMQSDTTSVDYNYHELLLTRSVLLAHPFAGKVAPGDVIMHARRYSSVTHWEELLCAAINPKASSLVAIVSVHLPDGYSGILRSLGSIEYVRFFIDWVDGEGFQAVGLTHFKVCDAHLGSDKSRFPYYHVVSTQFDADRYWDSVLSGIKPTVRAVLSWNQLPEMDFSFTPVFGNHIDSRICIDSEKDLLDMIEDSTMDEGKANMIANYG